MMLEIEPVYLPFAGTLTTAGVEQFATPVPGCRCVNVLDEDDDLDDDLDDDFDDDFDDDLDDDLDDDDLDDDDDEDF